MKDMKFGLNLAEDGRILSACIVNKFTPNEMPKVDSLPKGDLNDYLYVNGKFVKEPIPKDAEKNRIEEINQCKARLRELDYIGVKIATGRATIEEYSTEIAEMTRLAGRINELEDQSN